MHALSCNISFKHNNFSLVTFRLMFADVASIFFIGTTLLLSRAKCSCFGHVLLHTGTYWSKTSSHSICIASVFFVSPEVWRKNVLAHVHLFPGEKPKLNQRVKQMLLQGSLKQRCAPYLTDRNRGAVPGFRCWAVRFLLATASRCCFGKGVGEVDFWGAFGIGRLIRWFVVEDILSNEADTVGIEM